MVDKIKEKIIVVCQNRKARHEYHILDTLETGIVLTGSEIKSVVQHHVSLDGSYATVSNNEVWLIDSNIEPYKDATNFPHEQKRKRKLLLNKREIQKFSLKAEQKGHTLIPLKMYLKDGRAKVELAVCQGKNLHDKRQANKEKDARKEMRKFSI
jgi:SsrA-binding protein